MVTLLIAFYNRSEDYLLCRFVKLFLRKPPPFLFLFGHYFASLIAVLFSVREWAPSSSSEHRKENRGVLSLYMVLLPVKRKGFGLLIIWPRRNNLYPACYSRSKAARDLLVLRCQVPYPIFRGLSVKATGNVTRSPDKMGFLFQMGQCFRY